MARKKAKQSAVVSDKCFRLLRLKQEIQSDIKVLKAVVDEVDVLRLCRLLGMTVSDEGNRASKNKFEFGMFTPSDYDADFARFIREKLAAGSEQSEQDGADKLEVGCLFGKQLEVKAELARMGFWSSECEDGLSLQDQGVYCIESSGDRRQLVVFAWLDASLFEPEAIRNTPAYVLRFLITLSSNITCCLSQEDFRRVKSEVDAVSDSSSMRWSSCSVAFRVQKQVEQKDSISCGAVVKVSIPKFDRVKAAWFVGGVVSAVAVESSLPSTSEWVTWNDTVPYESFAEWLMKKRERFSIELPKRPLKPMDARDNLLANFGQFPEEELRALRTRFNEQLEEATHRIDREVFDHEMGNYGEAVQDARWLFAVRCPANASQMDSAWRHYQSLLQQWEQCGILANRDYQAYTMLYLPERIQGQMKVLDNAFQRHRSAFEEVLNTLVAGEPINADDGRRIWLLGVMQDAAQGVVGWLWRSNAQFSNQFRLAMEKHQPRLQRVWMDAVEYIVSLMQAAAREQRLQQSTKDREFRFAQEKEAALHEAFRRFREYLKAGDGHLSIKISKLMRTLDGNAVHIAWSEEVEKELAKVIRMYELGSTSPATIAPMGRMEIEPGFELRKLATVKLGQVVAILVKDSSTIVRRIQFPLQSSLKAEQVDVRTFPRACSLCSIRASDRRVAFLFDASSGRLGSVAFCRFNDSFTGVEATQSINVDASFGLANPLVDILLTERSLCAVDGKGDFQSFDHLGSGLLTFADELVVGRIMVDGNQQLCLSSISNEDHRALPTAVLGSEALSTELAVGSLGDVLYVVNAGEGTVYSSRLSVTVRSDAYRIQRSGNGAKSSHQKGCLQVDPKGKGSAAQHWLRVFYNVFEKFPVRSLVDMAMNPDSLVSLDLEVVVAGGDDVEEDHSGMEEATAVCVTYFNSLMADLRRLNKPLSGLNLAKKLKYRCSEKIGGSSGLQITSVRHVLLAVVSIVPVQICRAQDNMLKLLQDGEDCAKEASQTSSGHESDSTGTDASEIAQSIRFGLLSPLLESWNGRCVVVTSMGKQSTGKNYFLNHLAGTSFAISGSRCTDGAWMSLRLVSADVLLVVLDFEGLGSFERSEQEDIFLSVLNASVSLVTVFRMESRFDKDIDGLFSRFQKGVQLIKNDPRFSVGSCT
ncbi:hypothetical protein PHYPSEUDO_009759 [Phytophthora pseudosyringae]|uniref:VLIG-type G domain-containing protein n=1 Tax=Phytophthora pseudosyringae TaxID=221518 RepID=A0A8T1VEL1_9STRA|nr:hypothetical protein PHYPSEUDO_009759 [Phytophthora pseudosyringae]